MTPPADDALHSLPLPSEAEEAERSANLRVAPDTALEAARRRRRARLALLGVGAISAASMFGLVAFHVFAVQSSFQLDKLQSQLTTKTLDWRHFTRGRIEEMLRYGYVLCCLDEVLETEPEFRTS